MQEPAPGQNPPATSDGDRHDQKAGTLEVQHLPQELDPSQLKPLLAPQPVTDLSFCGLLHIRRYLACHTLNNVGKVKGYTGFEMLKKFKPQLEVLQVDRSIQPLRHGALRSSSSISPKSFFCATGNYEDYRQATSFHFL